MIEAWAGWACILVPDHWPYLNLPHWQREVASAIDVHMEALDSCRTVLVQATPRAFPTAHALRRFLQNELPSHLWGLSELDPFVGVDLVAAPALKDAIARRQLVADLADPRGLAREPAIDQLADPVAARDRAEEAGPPPTSRRAAAAAARAVGTCPPPRSRSSTNSSPGVSSGTSSVTTPAYSSSKS